MYEILTSMRQLESTPAGKNLTAVAKFRNGRDGIVDIFIRGLNESVITVEKSGEGYKVFANDTTWVRCGTIAEVLTWSGHKLSEIDSRRYYNG